MDLRYGVSVRREAGAAVLEVISSTNCLSTSCFNGTIYFTEIIFEGSFYI